MADQVGRGRGRARGRARDRDGPGPLPVEIPALQGVWNRRPGPRPPQEAIGDAPRRAGVRGPDPDRLLRQVEQLAIVPGGDGGGVGRGAGRGAIRRPPVPANEIVVPDRRGQPTKQGFAGLRIKLQANYFKLLSVPDWCLYQYRVDFAPDEDRTVVRKGLLSTHKTTLGPYIFDGTVLYTKNRLPENMELFSMRLSDQAQIRISIKEVGELVKGDQHYIQFFNIIMRKCLGHLNLQQVGRNFYDALAKIEIKDFKLELWPGYLTSIRQHERDILMCSEIDHKVMRQETLYHILCDSRARNAVDYKRDFATTVIGQVVLTDYNNKTYRIDDVDFKLSPQSTFKLSNGESISYMDYYRNKYGINIRNTTQPLLVSRTKPRERRAGQEDLIYLVPELCRATGLTNDMRAQWQLTRALSEHMRVGPDSRVKKLLAFNNRLRSEPKVVADLNEWSLKLSDKLIDVCGRKLPGQKIIFGNQKIVDARDEADWTRNLREVTMLSCGQLNNWALIVTNRDRKNAEDFISTLIQVSAKLGFRVSRPRVYEIRSHTSNSYVTAIEEILSQLAVNLIFCVVPDNRAERYSAIKKKCCGDRPVPSQVFLAKNLTSRGLASIATKVAIQMNCKIGGAPWAVHIPYSGIMFVGFDVCHDTLSKGRDFGALVATLDPAHSQYFSALSEHTNGEELSNDIAMNMAKALHVYKQRNNALPEKIIIYRDGVGEGQLHYVSEHEVGNLTRRLSQIYGRQKVKMAFIVVTKRINTRLFYGTGNPPPGTVVDDVITDPSKYDFFIIPQSVRQGTVSPTAFSVIYDTVEFNADQLQQLTYRMAHMYYNWSGTVRVPAPCQYAHKLAFFVSQYIHKIPNESLHNLMYYL